MNVRDQVPRVSVLMAARNVASFVDAAVQSVLRQTFHDFEFLIVDDASSDDTWIKLERWAGEDPRIRLFRNERSLTPPGCLNRLIPEARGEYLAIMDADDVAVPHRLEAQVAVLDTGEVDLCGGAYIEFPVTKLTLLGGGALNDDELKVSMLFEWAIMQPTVMLRASLLASERYRPEMVPAADYDLWARLAGKARMRTLPDTLLLKRVHAQQISQERAHLQESAAMRVRKMALGNLGLAPTDRELWLQSQVWRGTMPASWGDVIETERWLSRLAESIGHLPAARAHLHRRWYIYCLKAAPYGLKAHRLFRQSGLYSLRPASISQRLAVFLLCLLRIPYQSRFYWILFSIRPSARRLREEIRKLPPDLRSLLQPARL